MLLLSALQGLQRAIRPQIWDAFISGSWPVPHEVSYSIANVTSLRFGNQLSAEQLLKVSGYTKLDSLLCVHVANAVSACTASCAELFHIST